MFSRQKEERRQTWEHVFNPSSLEGGGKRFLSLRPTQTKGSVRFCLKNNKKTKGLRA
jgi:hypothetical protein